MLKPAKVARAGPPGARETLPWGLAWRLAFGQIVAWGILYYAFTVVVSPMEAETRWSRPFLNLGLTIGLLAWGVSAYPVGAWIQRRGARQLMAGSSVLGGLALAIMGSTTRPGLYLFAWGLLGVAMAGSLYETAFAVITAAFGSQYRRGIILITLVGGLASTVFIPFAQFAIDRLGWREALLLLAAIQAGVGFPLHWWGVPDVVGIKKPETGRPEWVGEWWRTLLADVRDARFLGLAVWFAAHAAAFTGLLFQLVPYLQARQVPTGSIILAITVMGPMQVTGRLLLSFWGERFSSLRVGLAAMGGLLLAVLVLWLLPPTLFWLCFFAGMLGLGNGMLTIVRGTSVAELFGRERYAEINGAIAAPAVLAKAAAPLAVAAVWSATNVASMVPLSVLVLLMVSLLGLLLAARVEAGMG